MTSAQAAGRELARLRWKDQRPRRLAEELTRRAGELPGDVRRQLLEALRAAELGGAA
jgi:hypothetical protein